MNAHLVEMICSHISNPPALVPNALSDLSQQLFLDFSGCQSLCNHNQVFHCQQANGILFVLLKFAIDWQTIRDYMRLREMSQQWLMNKH